MHLNLLEGKCVFSSEWDKYCQESYNLNFGEIPYGDIKEDDSIIYKYILNRKDIHI